MPIQTPWDLRLEVDGTSFAERAQENDEATAQSIPDSAFMFQTGDLKMGAYATVPTGWLLCDGTSVLRATYAALFAKIGVVYGSVDGTHFTLPDLRGRVPLGSGAGTATGAVNHALGDHPLAGVGGEEGHVQTIGELAAHTHVQTQATVASGGTELVGVSGNGSGSVANNGSTASTGSSTAFNIMQPHVAVNFFIKT